jgi:hypothetical protein
LFQLGNHRQTSLIEFLANMRGRNFFALLTNHSSDLVIMGEPPADMSLITQPFMENPLIAIAIECLTPKITPKMQAIGNYVSFVK